MLKVADAVDVNMEMIQSHTNLLQLCTTPESKGLIGETFPLLVLRWPKDLEWPSAHKIQSALVTGSYCKREKKENRSILYTLQKIQFDAFVMLQFLNCLREFK